MLSEYDEIKQCIKEIALSDSQINSILGYVKEVSEDKLSCTVMTADGSKTFNYVRFKEITDKEKKEFGFRLIPEIGSRVIIDCISESQAYISMVSEINTVFIQLDETNKFSFTQEEGFKLEVDKAVLDIQKDGFKMDKDGETLKTILSDLLDGLAQLTVSTGMGPSGTPINVATFQDIKTRLDTLFTG